ncbi:MAG TPA: Rrf2 family transcriptional regulator [Tepidisphaeraceae bacterium]|jgi:Rrf2 family protein|nr:Rrf2 family transcriptional regulator [Tepidisphaeraceae bacterium]
MLALGKKMDYALISLAWLAERGARAVSAREIAEANGLPLQALMQILKALHQHGVLRSTRGVKGGYQIGADLETMSLYGLGELLEKDEPQAEERDDLLRYHPPVEAMRRKLSQFMKNVSVSEVIHPGRRIDVPLRSVRVIFSSKEHCPCPLP